MVAARFHMKKSAEGETSFTAHAIIACMTDAQHRGWSALRKSYLRDKSRAGSPTATRSIENQG